MEEIKAGDIMLNNWFHVNGYPMYVDSIFQDTVYLEFEGNEGDVWEENIKDLVPIPLTEDILLKAGATPYRAKDTFILGDITIDIKLGIAMLNYIDCTPLLCKCKYMHTFQNIVKLLTGNDLKIEV